MKKKIAIVTGGYTGESVISLKSAEIVEKTIDTARYEVFKILIFPGDWYHITESGEKVSVDLNDFSLKIGQEKIIFDGVFNILHGSPGEDGKLAGYFDMIGLPYTTCDQVTSAITMNKAYTKAILSGIEEPFTARSKHLFENSTDNLKKLKKELTLPLFIKPNSGGSSIGMTKAKTWEELPEALEKAFAEDKQVLVEEFVSGREFSIGVFKSKGVLTVLPATEIVSSKEFFDFDSKYQPGITEEITPGRMTNEEVERTGRIVSHIYEKLNCKGAVRIDYFLQNGTGDFYFIEINTVPGQTETSLISQQVKAAGKEVKEFYTDLIEEMFSEL